MGCSASAISAHQHQPAMVEGSIVLQRHQGSSSSSQGTRRASLTVRSPLELWSASAPAIGLPPNNNDNSDAIVLDRGERPGGELEEASQHLRVPECVGVGVRDAAASVASPHFQSHLVHPLVFVVDQNGNSKLNTTEEMMAATTLPETTTSPPRPMSEARRSSSTSGSGSGASRYAHHIPQLSSAAVEALRTAAANSTDQFLQFTTPSQLPLCALPMTAGGSTLCSGQFHQHTDAALQSALGGYGSRRSVTFEGDDMASPPLLPPVAATTSTAAIRRRLTIPAAASFQSTSASSVDQFPEGGDSDASGNHGRWRPQMRLRTVPFRSPAGEEDLGNSPNAVPAVRSNNTIATQQRNQVHRFPTRVGGPPSRRASNASSAASARTLMLEADGGSGEDYQTTFLGTHRALMDSFGVSTLHDDGGTSAMAEPDVWAMNEEAPLGSTPNPSGGFMLRIPSARNAHALNSVFDDETVDIPLYFREDDGGSSTTTGGHSSAAGGSFSYEVRTAAAH